MHTIAKGLSLLCLLGAVAVMLVLQLCASNSSNLRNAVNGNQNNVKADQIAVQTSFSCEENGRVTNAPAKDQQESNSVLPEDLGVTRILTPVISEYLSGLLPRLLH